MMSSRIVYVSRLSAIGDLIIASSFIKNLAECGYIPILITHISLKDIACRIVGLKGFICLEGEGQVSYFLDGALVKKEVFTDYLRCPLSDARTLKAPFFVDIQKTSRSKKAFQILKTELNPVFEKKFFVQKKTFYRVFLLICAWLCFSQKPRKRQSQVPFTISQLQNRLLDKICAYDGKSKIYFETSPSLARELTLSEESPTPSYVCLFPGSSGFIKSWPKESFRSLIHMILEKTPHTIFLCGGPGEISIAEYLCFPPHARVINVVGQHSLGQTLSLISRASYVFSNDSFAGHAAAAYGVRGSVIYGPTTPLFGFLAPSPPITTLYANLKCSPCSRHGKNECRYKNLKCMTSITPQEVFESARSGEL